MKKYLEFINESKTYQHVKEPLFHGSGSYFRKFDFEVIGKDSHFLSFLGIHFTESDEVAEQFLKPPDYKFYEVRLKYNKYLEIKESDLVKDILKFGFNKKIIAPKYQFSLDLPYYIPYDAFKDTEDCNRKYIPKDITQKTALEYKKILMNKGYDCIKYINEIELPEIERYDWIAFNQDQIQIIKVWDQKPELK